MKKVNFPSKLKDFSVSGEEFSLVYDTDYDLLRTAPIPNDLDRYYESEDYISHTDSRRSLFEKVYHLVKSSALRSKVNLISTNASGRQLLDIGSGTGDFLVEVKSKGWNVTGFEPNPSARKLSEQKGIVISEKTQDLPDATFDVITMWHVLEHVPDVKAQITELKRLIKPGGLVVIAVPNFKSHDAQIYKEHWAAFDVPRHLTHFSRSAIEKLFTEQGFSYNGYRPMWFDSFYVSLLSEKYRSGSMKPIKSLFNGLISNLKGLKSGEYSSHIYLLKDNRAQ